MSHKGRVFLQFHCEKTFTRQYWHKQMNEQNIINVNNRNVIAANTNDQNTIGVNDRNPAGASAGDRTHVGASGGDRTPAGASAGDRTHVGASSQTSPDVQELETIANRARQAIHSAIDRELRLMDVEITRFLRKKIADVEKPASRLIRKSKLKFDPLYDYFRNNEEKALTLTFDELGEIIGAPLCRSAYKFREYWMRNGRSRLSDCWSSNGYKIKTLDLENKWVSFYRIDPIFTQLL